MRKVIVGKRKTAILIILIVLILGCILLGISYAFWQLTYKQNDFDTLGVNCFELTLTNEQNDINLQSAYPISDEEGMILTPYTFTITNTCNTYAYYQVNLEELQLAEGDLN